MKLITVVQGPRSQTGMWVVIVFVVMFSLLLFREDPTLFKHLVKTTIELIVGTVRIATSGPTEKAQTEGVAPKQEPLERGSLERQPANATNRLKPVAIVGEPTGQMPLSANERLPHNASKVNKKKPWHPER